MAVHRIKKVSNTTLSYRWKSFVKMKNQISMPDDTNPYAGGDRAIERILMEKYEVKTLA